MNVPTLTSTSEFWKNMSGAPLNGRILLLCVLTDHDGRFTGQRAVEGFWGPDMRGVNHWRPWLGSVNTHSTENLLPLKWAYLPTKE